VTLSWINNGSGGGGAPGGSSGNLQYNNSGAFGGMSEWNYASPALTVTKTALGTNLTDVFVLTNTTASLPNQKQFGPAQHFSSTTYDNSLSSPGSVTADHRLFEGSNGALDPGYGSQAISAATNTTPITATTGAAHGYITGQQVVVTNGTGNTGVNGTYFVQVVNSTQFNLIGSAGNGVYSPNSAKVARAGNGWLGFAGQYNGAGYNTVGGIDT